jgi:chorismate mutase
MKKNEFETALASFRAEIDEIDEQIFSLIIARSQVVNRVKNLKKTHIKSDELFIKPIREGEILEKFSNQYGLYSKKLAHQIVRNLIVASNCLEQELKIGYVYGINMQVIQEFYTNLPQYLCLDGAEIFESLVKGEILIAIVPKKADFLDKIPDKFTIFHEIDGHVCIGKVQENWNVPSVKTFFWCKEKIENAKKIENFYWEIDSVLAQKEGVVVKGYSFFIKK